MISFKTKVYTVKVDDVIIEGYIVKQENSIYDEKGSHYLLYTSQYETGDNGEQINECYDIELGNILSERDEDL